MQKIVKRIRWFMKASKPRPFSYDQELERRYKMSKEKNFLFSTPQR